MFLNKDEERAYDVLIRGLTNRKARVANLEVEHRIRLCTNVDMFSRNTI